jgi:histidine ammonia-lyase
MLAQYTAAALVSRCRTLAHPASADSASVSGDQEDHVSMGMLAALDLAEITEHVTHVLAAELICAAQAAAVGGRPLPERLLAVREALDASLPPVSGDVPLHERLLRAADLLRRGTLAATCG